MSSTNRKHTEFLFATSDYEKVQEFLDDHPELDLTVLRDDKNSNVLHQTAFTNRLPLMKLYLAHMKKVFEEQYWKSNSQYRKSAKLCMEAWINEANNDGFTPIHYASYKGNVEMIKLLEDLRASIVLETKAGLNVLHLAAQGDRMASMIHFYERFDLNCLDSKKGTPLHWACYMGSENVTAFLLAQPQVQIDMFDEQEQTPLHLATIYGNTRIVRRLLVKGADRTLRNGKGEKPIEIAKANEFNNIARMLSEDFTCIDHWKFYYNLKTEYKPQDRSYARSILMLLGLLFGSITSHLLLVPTFSYYYLAAPAAYFLVLFAIIFTLLVPPQTINTPKPYKSLINKLPICSECRIPKKDRSYHCDICKVCVAQYDHHCPWTNNCVGNHNVGRFVTFLLMMIVAMLEITLVSLWGILRYHPVKEYRFISEGSKLELVYKIVLGINIFLCLLYIVPLMMLTYVQITNLCVGLTTYERYSNRGRNQTRTSSVKESTASENSLAKESLLKKKRLESTGSCSCSNCISMCSTVPQDEEQEDEAM